LSINRRAYHLERAAHDAATTKAHAVTANHRIGPRRGADKRTARWKSLRSSDKAQRPDGVESARRRRWTTRRGWRSHHAKLTE
jgi:hypothetical protein